MSRREREEVQSIVMELIDGYNESRTVNVDLISIVSIYCSVCNDYLCFDGTLRERHIEFAGFLTGYIQGSEQEDNNDVLADLADYVEDTIYLKDYDLLTQK